MGQVGIGKSKSKFNVIFDTGLLLLNFLHSNDYYKDHMICL